MEDSKGTSKNTIILVNKAIVYDIHKQMTNNQTAIKNYSTNIMLKRLSGDLPLKVIKAPIASGDRDCARRGVSDLVDLLEEKLTKEGIIYGTLLRNKF